MTAPSDWARRVGQRVVVRHRLPDGSATDVVGELLHADLATGRLVVAGRHGEVTVPLGAVLAGKVVPPRPVRAAPPHQALSIDDLERVTALHWLPPDRERLGDWLLRAAGGFTGRGNSALVVGSAGVSGAQAVAEVTAWYARRGLTPRASIPGPAGPEPPGTVPSTSAPPAAAPFLAAGWQAVAGAGALVLTGATRALTAGPELPPGLTLDLAPVPDEAWRGLYRYHGQALPAAALDLLLSAPEQTFVSVRSEGCTVAVARGALASAWLGVTAVEVAPDHRRRGLGRLLLTALARWAVERDARSTSLQVAVGNEAAQRLYLSTGLTVHHRYDYFVPPR